MSARLRRAVLRLSSSRWFPRFVDALEATRVQQAGVLNVLTYHRVDDPEANPRLYAGTLSATPDEFRLQMEHLLSSGFQFVSISDVLDAVAGKVELPPLALLITFDDAYRDFAEHAWPTLARLGIPATLFVPTCYPDNPQMCFWWDRLAGFIHDWPSGERLTTPAGHFQFGDHAARIDAVKKIRDYIKSLPADEAMSQIGHWCRDQVTPADNHVLSWESLRQLATQGVSLGAHTRTHPLVHRVSLDHAREEVLGSLADLKRQLGAALPIFAYPSGAFSAEVVEMLQREGVKLAFTTSRGANNLRNANPLLLRRISVGRNTNGSLLRAQMLPAVGRVMSLLPVRSAV